MYNHLKGQTSPYLLQHAENPVNWYPWGDEAFEAAAQEDKPIFLSIGYSTCHWCHVMAHESFENQETADLLNQYFIAIKVDREERPDIDSVYMSVCQAFTGNGGWPMSIFMTPRQVPFFAGTYFPPRSHRSMIGFRELLLTIADRWEHNRAGLLNSADKILAALNKKADHTEMKIDDSLPERAAELFALSFDAKNGGFGSAPKFPMPHNLLFLMLYSHLTKETEPFSLVKTTLEKMRRGGIFDQIGCGFSRYSTDDYFLVPHFEKMLYDNALLIIAYSSAYKMSKEQLFLDTAVKTADYILREMTDINGGFYAAQDADSGGEEGQFYVWTIDEICHVLGSETGMQLCRYYGMTQQGNFEGKNIPNLLNGNEISDAFEQEKKLLYNYRLKRARLHLDDKILTSWNGLMICAMSVLYRVTGENKYLEAAIRAQKFIDESLCDETSLYVSCRRGRRSVKGFLDDYAYETAALLGLYDACGNTSYLDRAEKLCREAVDQFEDKNGGYFLYGTKNSPLITRPKESYDGALPSGNSVMAYCLVRLSQLTDDGTYQAAAGRQLAYLSAQSADYPPGYSMFLTALLYHIDPPPRITVLLADEAEKTQIMLQLPLYAQIRILTQETDEYKLLNGQTTYYVCQNHTCLPPSNTLLKAP